MNWYLAKIVYRIICGDGDHTPQFDEQLRLISAADEKEAFTKAQLIGEQEQEIFFNQDQKLVHWQFVNISELLRISALIDGAEIYSRIKETDNAAIYEELIHRKAAGIQSNIQYRYIDFF